MISLKERFPTNDAIWVFSNPKIAQKKAFEFYGPNAILHRSNTKNKKYCIETPEGKKINFGQMGFFDFTRTNDELKRYHYLQRTSKIRGDWKSNKYSPNNLSRTILW